MPRKNLFDDEITYTVQCKGCYLNKAVSLLERNHKSTYNSTNKAKQDTEKYEKLLAKAQSIRDKTATEGTKMTTAEKNFIKKYEEDIDSYPMFKNPFTKVM